VHESPGMPSTSTRGNSFRGRTVAGPHPTITKKVRESLFVINLRWHPIPRQRQIVTQLILTGTLQPASALRLTDRPCQGGGIVNDASLIKPSAQLILVLKFVVVGVQILRCSRRQLPARLPAGLPEDPLLILRSTFLTKALLRRSVCARADSQPRRGRRPDKRCPESRSATRQY
jgi:hypothetical protein